ncbi:MAG: hypothetical protein IJZ39_07210 [Oscillospiraceae bacterium]|nr:hypothetical protein [Oscillospiraceae bacterium]
MAKGKTGGADNSDRKVKPALSPESEEQQMINLAVKVAKQRMLDGTASSQIIVHYLKLATENTQLEREKLRSENKLLDAKAEAIQSQKRDEELYQEVLDALKLYVGHK